MADEDGLHQKPQTLVHVPHEPVSFRVDEFELRAPKLCVRFGQTDVATQQIHLPGVLHVATQQLTNLRGEVDATDGRESFLAARATHHAKDAAPLVEGAVGLVIAWVGADAIVQLAAAMAIRVV